MAAVVSPSLYGGRPRPAPVPARVFRRRRLTTAAVLVAVLIAVVALAGGTGRPSPVLVADRLEVVQPGDTFWSIARRIQPGGDPRPLVDWLVQRHGGAHLQVGERIAVPPGA